MSCLEVLALDQRLRDLERLDFDWLAAADPGFSLQPDEHWAI